MRSATVGTLLLTGALAWIPALHAQILREVDTILMKARQQGELMAKDRARCDARERLDPRVWVVTPFTAVRSRVCEWKTDLVTRGMPCLDEELRTMAKRKEVGVTVRPTPSGTDTATSTTIITKSGVVRPLSENVEAGYLTSVYSITALTDADAKIKVLWADGREVEYSLAGVH